ncbi:Inosine/uridine-preferring nucleoside hydrolase domain protein [Kalmanozyma brasiliensis GHG001]|uniref:Inosine-uridine preferring nucleoside hydrolase n=1 Tax=Kalmanozyma brasiliensis (strain GHG001) TaxID=1365824 RepID=V5EBF6_KALBG|nr:Inosine/uridine-preferring nucleoside hydrolase domain protein [Kalmanozyma brasiliensis GHG001]EST07736.1 Inosine/uridine-preferring nucleoside hydrolase domain protein [Kalmanozyma brasiliensis GHG001]
MTSAKGTPTPLIIDTDPGVDDVLALLLALASPDEVAVKAITLTFGNTTLDHAYANVLRTGAVLQRHLADPSTPEAVKKRYRSFSADAEPIVIASGSTEPLEGKMLTASYFHGRDGLSGVNWLPDDPFPVPKDAIAPLSPTDKHAADVILDIIRQHPPHSVRIAALGPLTNLAAAFRKDPETFAKVGAISVMGGAFDVPGNTSPVAEFNWYADPYSVRVLVDEAPRHPALQGRRLPIQVLALDITSEHTVPYSSLVKATYETPDDTPQGASHLERYIGTFLTHPRAFTNNLVAPEEFHPDQHDLFQAHDPLAIAHAIFAPMPASGSMDGKRWKHTPRRFQIETSGDLTRGFCVVDRRFTGSGSSRKIGGNRAEDAEAEEELHVIENADVPVHRKKQKTDESQIGLVDEVTRTPGIEWFAKMFLERIGL